MRIALETSCLVARNQTGISRYARELSGELLKLLTPDDQLCAIYAARRMRRRHLLPRYPQLHDSPWLRHLYPPQSRFDLLHTMHWHFPGWTRMPVIRTLHDLYAHVGIEGEHATVEHSELAQYRALADTADHVICVSENTRRDFLRHYAFPADRVSVTPLGVGSQFRPQPQAELAGFRQRFNLSRPYFLSVGNAHPNKNLSRLMQAYRESPVSADYDWVIVGRIRGAGADELLGSIEQHRLQSRVHLLGSIAERELPLAYAGAAALLFPSLYEGYGLPILEAMASGVAVLTSDRGSCPEVADGHAVLVDPYSVAAIGAGLEAVLAVDAAGKARAKLHAQSRTWAATAQATLQIYQRYL